jgi:hypothetical protein
MSREIDGPLLLAVVILSPNEDDLDHGTSVAILRATNQRGKHSFRGGVGIQDRTPEKMFFYEDNVRDWTSEGDRIEKNVQ